MKLILLHGDDNKKSYDRLSKFIDSAKKRKWSIERFNATDNIADLLVSQSLFDNKKLYIMDDVDKLNKKKLQWMRDNLDEIDGTLVLYSKKEVSKTLMRSLPMIDKTEEFKLPKIIWSFLDSLYPGNARNSLKLFHNLIQNDAPEFVFSLIVKQIRDMYYLKLDSDSIDYPSWRKNKLMSQSKKYDDNKLENMILKLSKADLKTKTSHANIADQLDLIIATELE